MSKSFCVIIFLTCFISGFAQKADLAFTGNREKSAQFLYSKSDFDSLMVHFFLEPAPLAICNDYKLNLTLSATIDTNKNISKINFKNFDLVSTLMISPDNPASVPLFAAIRDSIRKVLYRTNGMWESKSKNNKPENCEIVIKTSIRKRSGKVFNESNEEQMQGGKVYYYKVGAKRSNPDFFYNYGVSQLKENKYKLAKAYFEEVIYVNPNDIDAYYNLGMCFKGMNDMVSACKNWDKCFLLGDRTALEAIKQNCGDQK